MKLNNYVKAIVFCSLIISSLSVQTQSEDKEKEKIFISEKNMKHKKSRGTPQDAILPTSSAGNVNDAVSQDLMKNTNLLATAGINQVKNQPEDVDIGNGPIFFSGWIKFFKYNEADITTTNTPKHFYQNNAFFEQAKLYPNVDLSTMDTDGKAKYIRDKSYFWLNVFADSINFISSKEQNLQTTFDNLQIDNIKPVYEDEKYEKGGILNFGNFSEGFCMKINAFRPSFIWIVCAETQEEKDILMAVIKKLKIQRQRMNGQILLDSSVKNNKKNSISNLLNDKGDGSSLKSDNQGNLGVGFNSTQKVTDGYWITLQDWSQCDRACGGGKSTFHRMCVPPKQGGRECIGDPVIERVCNTQPCPDVNGTGDKNSNNTTTLKPIIKILPFSSRPQRYTKCVIKEGDLMLFTSPDSPNLLNNPLLKTRADGSSLQIPTRAIMNNRTITLFGGEEYDTLILTFNLKYTMFSRSAKHQGCFILNENSGKNVAELCPFGCESASKAIEEWDYDFNLFKFQCNTAKDIIELDKSDFNKKLEDKIKNAKNQLLSEREEELKKKVAQKEDEKINEVIKDTNKIALQAIQKEMNLEDMIRKEEAEREAREEKEIKEAIEAEKRKSECLVKAIKERKLENQYNLRAKEAEEEVKNIKNTAAEQVSIRRSQLKNLLEEMRKKAERKKAKLKQQLQTVRNEMAQEMGKAYKKGDLSRCENGLKSDQDRKVYCSATFIEDFSNYSTCLEGGEEFCLLCCETEYGDFYLGERQECIKNLCGNRLSGSDLYKNAATTGVDGRWIWHEAVKVDSKK